MRDSRHHVEEKPLPQPGQGFRRQLQKCRPARPEESTRYLAGSVDVFRAIGEVEAQIHFRLNFKGRMALEGNSFFADVDDLVQIEGRSLRLLDETGVGRGLNLVSHTPATVG